MKFILAFLAACIPLLSWAQSRAFDCQGQEMLPINEAKTLVSKVQDSFNAALEISEVAAGRFFFSNPGRMKWEYQSPRKQSFLLQDGTIWLYQEEERQVLIDSADNVLLSDLPLSFLIGLGNLERDFDVTAACKTPDGSVLELKSSRAAGLKAQASTGLKLLIGAASYFPSGASVTDAGGNNTSIILSAVEPQADLPENTFVPSYPEGVDIQDRRLKEENERASR